MVPWRFPELACTIISDVYSVPSQLEVERRMLRFAKMPQPSPVSRRLSVTSEITLEGGLLWTPL